MCLSCGCHRPADTHGDPGHITMADLVAAAKAASIPPGQAAENILNEVRATTPKGTAEQLTELLKWTYNASQSRDTGGRFGSGGGHPSKAPQPQAKTPAAAAPAAQPYSAPAGWQEYHGAQHAAVTTKPKVPHHPVHAPPAKGGGGGGHGGGNGARSHDLRTQAKALDAEAATDRKRLKELRSQLRAARHPGTRSSSSSSSNSNSKKPNVTGTAAGSRSSTSAGSQSATHAPSIARLRSQISNLSRKISSLHAQAAALRAQADKL